MSYNLLLFLVDINECANNPCTGAGAQCNNTDGAYSCYCDVGYSLNADGTTCSGINYIHLNY